MSSTLRVPRFPRVASFVITGGPLLAVIAAFVVNNFSSIQPTATTTEEHQLCQDDYLQLHSFPAEIPSLCSGLSVSRDVHSHAPLPRLLQYANLYIQHCQSDGISVTSVLTASPAPSTLETTFQAISTLSAFKYNSTRVDRSGSVVREPRTRHRVQISQMHELDRTSDSGSEGFGSGSTRFGVQTRTHSKDSTMIDCCTPGTQQLQVQCHS